MGGFTTNVIHSWVEHIRRLYDVGDCSGECWIGELETISFSSLDFESLGIAASSSVCATFNRFGSLKCGGTPVMNNATCHGEAILISAAIIACNEINLPNLSGLVEVTGDLRLWNTLTAEIATVRLPNLVAMSSPIGEDLYVASVESAAALLSIPSLVNVSGGVAFQDASSETIEIPCRCATWVTTFSFRESAM